MLILSRRSHLRMCTIPGGNSHPRLSGGGTGRNRVMVGLGPPESHAEVSLISTTRKLRCPPGERERVRGDWPYIGAHESDAPGQDRDWARTPGRMSLTGSDQNTPQRWKQQNRTAGRCWDRRWLGGLSVVVVWCCPVRLRFQVPRESLFMLPNARSMRYWTATGSPRYCGHDEHPRRPISECV